MRAADLLPIDPTLVGKTRKAGYTTALVAPTRGVFRGTAALVCLADGQPSSCVLDSDHAQVFAFEHARFQEPGYPSSLMGAIALARQTLLDTGWHRDAWASWQLHPRNVTRPVENLSLRALLPLVEGKMPIVMECENEVMIPRAIALAREFRLRPTIVAGGCDIHLEIDRGKRWIDQAGAPLVVSVDFPEPPHWDE